MSKVSRAVLATGGIDSTVLLYYLKNKYPKDPLVALTVDYGHVAFAKQHEILTEHCSTLGIVLNTIPMDLRPYQKRIGLFVQGYKPVENDPLGDWNARRYEDFFIEGRNMLMVTHALSFCSSFAVDELHAGYLYSEEEWKNRHTVKLLTGDNSPQFVDAINVLAQMGFSYPVRFRALYYEKRMDKAAVIALGKKLCVDLQSTYSCYFVPECGVCDNCLLRKEFLK